MRNKKRKIKTLIIVVTILTCILFLFPKQRVIGGLRGGPIGPGQTAYREDYTCMGIELQLLPELAGLRMYLPLFWDHHEQDLLYRAIRRC